MTIFYFQANAEKQAFKFRPKTASNDSCCKDASMKPNKLIYLSLLKITFILIYLLIIFGKNVNLQFGLDEALPEISNIRLVSN